MNRIRVQYGASERAVDSAVNNRLLTIVNKLNAPDPMPAEPPENTAEFDRIAEAKFNRYDHRDGRA